MSLSQRSLGCADVKSRLMRFGDALVLRESVVTRKRRIAVGRIPALCISWATVLRQHGASWAISSTCTLGAPYDSRLAWWIVLIRAVRSTWRRRRALGHTCRAASCPLRETCSASHRAGTPYCRRFFSTKAYFTSLPERSRWPLFL